MRQHGYRCLALTERDTATASGHPMRLQPRIPPARLSKASPNLLKLINSSSWPSWAAHRLPPWRRPHDRPRGLRGRGRRPGTAQRFATPQILVTQTAELDSAGRRGTAALAFKSRRDPRLRRYSLQHNSANCPMANGAQTRPQVLVRNQRRRNLPGIQDHFQNAARIKCPALIIRRRAKRVLA